MPTIPSRELYEADIQYLTPNQQTMKTSTSAPYQAENKHSRTIGRAVALSLRINESN